MKLPVKIIPRLELPILPGVFVDLEFETWGRRDPEVAALAKLRLQHAEQLVAEIRAALADDQLNEAADRLMVLADQFRADQRAHATFVYHQVRALPAHSTSETSALRATLAAQIDAVSGTYHATARTAWLRASKYRDGTEKDSRDPLVRPTAQAIAKSGDVGLASTRPAVSCHAVSCRIGTRSILYDATLSLMPGAIVGVIGKNGAGKTTLLRLIAGDLEPTEGTVTYPALQSTGAESDWYLDRIAYVPQIPTEYSGELEDNLRMFAALRGFRGADQDAEVSSIMARFGLVEFAQSEWKALSAGFRTRVELARAVSARPDLLVLDEPLGPLDPDAKGRYLRDLRDVADSYRRVCVVITSQDHATIGDVADYLVILRDGEVAFAGTADEVAASFDEHEYEFAGDFTEEEVRREFADFGAYDLTASLTGKHVVAGAGLAPNMVLSALLRMGKPIRFFRDLSRSPERFLSHAREEEEHGA